MLSTWFPPLIKDVYLETSRASVMEYFWKNNESLKAVNYYSKTTPSKIFNLVLNTLLDDKSNKTIVEKISGK